MIWYTWRQSRIALLLFFAIAFVIGIALVIIGQHMYQDVHSLQNPICQQGDICSATSQGLTSNQMLFHTYSIGLLALPPLLGIFLGAPLVAGEYEQRTYQFIWTQGITRRQWLTIQLAILFGVVIMLTLILGLLVNWGVSAAFAPTANANTDSIERFSLWGFDLSGTAPAAYAAFALALGLVGGALLRRTLPAIGMTLGGYLAVRLPLAIFVRPYYLPPLIRTIDIRSLTDWNTVTGRFAWVLEQGVQQNGQRTPNGFTVPAYCASYEGANNVDTHGLFQCMHDHGWSQYIIYQPYTRFWLFQGIETGIFLALAIGFVAVTFALVLRRSQ